jgi:hypothetical protein
MFEIVMDGTGVCCEDARGPPWNDHIEELLAGRHEVSQCRRLRPEGGRYLQPKF